MKKIIVVIGFILLANASFAQMAVVDATANTNIATGNAKSAMFFSKSLAEAGKQFEKLKQNNNFFDVFFFIYTIYNYHINLSRNICPQI